MKGLNGLRFVVWLFLLGIFSAWVFWVLQKAPATKLELEPRGNYTNIDGHRMYYVEKGAGPVVLILPGVPQHAESMSELLKFPWGHHRVMAVDFPEQGHAEKKGNRYSPDDYALFLKLFIDKMEIQNADIIGHDLGAGVAMVFAVSYPRRVGKMVLLSPPLDGCSLDQTGAWRRWPVLGEIWSAVFLNRDWLRNWLQRNWKSAVPWETAVEEYYQPWNSFRGRQGLLALWRGCGDFSYAPYKERLQTPTLLLLGGEDPLCRRPSALRLQTQRPNVTFKIIPAAGHFLADEAPGQTYEAIRDFLGLQQAVSPNKPAVSIPAVRKPEPTPVQPVPTKIRKPSRPETRAQVNRSANTVLRKTKSPAAAAPETTTRSAASATPVPRPVPTGISPAPVPTAEPTPVKPLEAPEPVPAAETSGESGAKVEPAGNTQGEP